MNEYRSNRCSTFLLLAVFSCAVFAGEGRAEESSYQFQLEVNDRHLPVFFEDGSLTEDEKKAVVGDYQLLLDELAPDKRHRAGPRRIQREGIDVRITNTFGYSARHLKRPEGLEREIGILGRADDDQEYIVVQKKLSDGYKAAMALKSNHQEACRSLPRFLALLNNLTDAQVPAAKDFFYLHGANKKYSEELAKAPKQKIVEEYRGFRYTWVSILEFRNFEGKLLTIVYAMNKDDGHLYDRPVIYDDGRWKILIARPGT